MSAVPAKIVLKSPTKVTLSDRSALHIIELEDCAEQLDLLQHTVIPRKMSIENDQCSEHKKMIDIFCVTCKQCICHVCALFGSKHSGHVFKPVDIDYGEHFCKVKDEVTFLKRKILELISLLQAVERNNESVTTAKDERVREITNVIELMIARLEYQLKSQLLSLMGQTNKVSQEMELLAPLIEKIENLVEHNSNPNLITRYHELLEKCKKFQMHRKPMASFVTAHVLTDITSEILPPFESSTFVMNSFSALQQRADPVYSQPLQVDGLCWRLKVYPDGGGVARGNYLSVFLELLAGPSETAKYEYRVEMVHQASRDSSRNFVREFSSDFEVGNCWGCDCFFRLDHLATDGYLNINSDSLTLRIHVRPPTFYQKCQDLQWYIHQVETRENKNLAKLHKDIALELLRINKHSNKKGSSRDSPISLMDDQVLDNIYSKYCHGNQPVNEAGSKIEIERAEDDYDTDSTDSKETDGILAFSQCDFLSLSHNEDKRVYSVWEEVADDKNLRCRCIDVESSIVSPVWHLYP